MNTLTHWLVNASVDRAARNRARGGPHPIATRPFLWGAVAPDLPLILLTVGAMVWYPLSRGWSPGRTFSYVFRVLFFTDPFWIVSSNLLHAPLLLGGALLAAWAVRERWPRPARSARWFLTGCALHTALDIPVHHDDGPLVLFPFEWTLRFRSPISYWDPAHYGEVVETVEMALAGVLVAYLLWPRLARRWGKPAGRRG